MLSFQNRFEFSYKYVNLIVKICCQLKFSNKKIVFDVSNKFMLEMLNLINRIEISCKYVNLMIRICCQLKSNSEKTIKKRFVFDV